MEYEDYNYDNHTFENYTYDTHLYEDCKNWYQELDNIWTNVILPVFVSFGLVVNVVAFCGWLFGQKSKSMCCAIYFAANSAVDFLFLTEPLLWGSSSYGWYERIIPTTDFTCKLFKSFYSSCAQLTTCISAIITVERSLTILFPFVFKSQDMRKRSKIVLAVIIVLQPFVQSLIYYDRIGHGRGFCHFSSKAVGKVNLVFSNVVGIIIPLAVTLTFNVATVATLIRQRSRRQSVSGRRHHVNVYTKLTLLTGVSFCLSYTMYTVLSLHVIFRLGMPYKMIYILFPHAVAMIYFNSVMNPIICYIVCKSVRDDIKHFKRALARRIRRCCTCGRSQRDIPTPNVAHGTPAIYNIELTSRNAGTRCSPNVETTSV